MGEIVRFLLGMGIPGIFLLALLDSTFFFFLPFALDIFLILLISGKDEWFPIYVAIAVAGSVVGSMITYVVANRSAATTFHKQMSGEKFKKVAEKAKRNSFWGILVTALLPPPFPFTPFVIAAAVAETPRNKVLAGVSVGRTIRYTLEGLLAIFFGGAILKLLDSTIFQAFMLGLFGVAVSGSIYSVVKWMRAR